MPASARSEPEARTHAERRLAAPARGILRSDRPDGVLERQRVLPPASLAPFIHHFWWLRWDLQSPFVGEALAHPCAHLRFEEHGRVQRAQVAGVCASRVAKRLAGSGRIFGITFRAGAFQPLLGGSMARLLDQSVPIERVFGAAGQAWAEQIFAVADFDEQIALAEAFLVPRLRSLSRDVQRLRDLVELLARDRTFMRVEQIAQALEVDVRSLQRRFLRYVGVSPKWVIQRYRLHEAAEQLRGVNPPTLAALAASLGYADQAHFARDFKLSVGRSPSAFQRT